MEELFINGAQAEDIVFDLEVEDDTGADLTGNVFEFVVYERGTTTTVHRQTDAQLTRFSGALRLNIPRTTTATLSVGRYPLNLWMTAAGIKSQVAYGELTITEGVA